VGGGEGRFRGNKGWRRRGQRREEGACREKDKDRAKRGTEAGAKRKEVEPGGATGRNAEGQRNLIQEMEMQD
jgi:hypothetical protein